MPDPYEDDRELLVEYGREGDDDRDPRARAYGALRIHAGSVGDGPAGAARFALDSLLRERERVDGAILRCGEGRWWFRDPPDVDLPRDLSGWRVPLDVRLAAAEALGLAPDVALGSGSDRKEPDDG